MSELPQEDKQLPSRLRSEAMRLRSMQALPAPQYVLDMEAAADELDKWRELPASDSHRVKE